MERAGIDPTPHCQLLVVTVEEGFVTTARPTNQAIDRAYQRLLAGEPDAPSDLITLLLEPLIATLTRTFPTLPNPEVIIDTVTDTLFRFVQDPARFNPARGSLWNYLLMDARGDLRNRWQQERRRYQRERPFDPVAHDLPDRNSDVEETVIRALVPGDLPADRSVANLIARLRAEIADSQDWQIVRLMLEGERSTVVYAQVLGIADLPPAEQRKRVKQAKDRLRVKLKRLRETLR